jgi:hypothetical protein
MINLVKDTIDKDDIKSLISWLDQETIPRLTKGDLTIELEKKWADKLVANILYLLTLDHLLFFYL